MVLRATVSAALLALAAAWPAPAQAPDPLVQEVRDGAGRRVAAIDWQARQITAVGRARRQAGLPRSALERAAILDAYANLGLASRQARVDAERSVGDLPDDDQQLARFLVSYVRGAAIGRLEADDEPGWVRLRAVAPLYGVDPLTGPTGLASFVQRRDDVLARDVSAAPPPPGDLTGVRFDATGLGLAGAVAPVVRDELGRVVWHIECADRGRTDAAGAIEYRSAGTAPPGQPREGERPLVVKVLQVVDGCDLLVSNADGQRLAPRQVGIAGGLVFASFGWVRTITPVSPFRQAAAVTSWPQAEEPDAGEGR